MSLAAVLRSTTGLSDLPRLVAEFGHEPLWEELPPWPDAHRAATVGRHGRFLWIGVESCRPVQEVTGRIARRLLNNGCAAGVIVVYPAARELGIAAGLAEPSVLRVALDEPAAISLAALRRLSGIAVRSPTAFAVRAGDVLDGRGIGHEFFRRFRSLVDAAAAAVHGSQLRNVGHRRSLALLQLTRVLFLYFVQSKGWLDGRPDFLTRAVDGCLARRRALQRQLFDPLFFGTLNRPVEARTRGTRGFGAIPFLNGGLFEPHPLERRYRPALPDAFWREAFDQLFERFHFTVGESDSGTPSIAPDMLGRVFEGVMAPADRRASGTFYTPATLVRDLVEASCITLLASRLECSDADAAQRFHAGDPAAHAALASATILDPACGSGAFLLGALERLGAARVALGERPDAARRSVLQHQLFGVDLNGTAVRLAELRLWLAVVAQDDTIDPRAVRPLPNLDCLLRQGDSLHEPASARIACSAALANAARAARQQLVTATGVEKIRLAAGLRRIELSAAVESANTRERRARARLDELLETLRAPTLFGERAEPSADQRRTLRALRGELREASAARRGIRASGDIPWFHYESQFPDVMARGGFDIVIGNPPWVRAEALPAELRRRLAARFHWWRAPHVRGFGHHPDLAIAFLERAHELVAPGGVVTQLVPAKIATAAYGCAARESLVRETTIHVAADLTGSDRARFGATVYPMALVTSRRPAPAGHLVRSSLEPGAGGIEQERLGGLGTRPARRKRRRTANRCRLSPVREPVRLPAGRQDRRQHDLPRSSGRRNAAAQTCHPRTRRVAVLDRAAASRALSVRHRGTSTRGAPRRHRPIPRASRIPPPRPRRSRRRALLGPLPDAGGARAAQGGLGGPCTRALRGGPATGLRCAQHLLRSECASRLGGRRSMCVAQLHLAPGHGTPGRRARLGRLCTVQRRRRRRTPGPAGGPWARAARISGRRRRSRTGGAR